MRGRMALVAVSIVLGISAQSWADSSIRFAGQCEAFAYVGNFDLTEIHRARISDGALVVETVGQGKGPARQSISMSEGAPEDTLGIGPDISILPTGNGFEWLVGNTLVTYELGSQRVTTEAVTVASHESGKHVELPTKARISAMKLKTVFKSEAGFIRSINGTTLTHLHRSRPVRFVEEISESISHAVADQHGEPRYIVTSSDDVLFKSSGNWAPVALPAMEPKGQRVLLPKRGDEAAWVLAYRYRGGGNFRWTAVGELASGQFRDKQPDGWPTGGQVVDFAFDPLTGNFVWWRAYVQGLGLSTLSKDGDTLPGLAKVYADNDVIYLIQASTDGTAALIGAFDGTAVKVFRVGLSKDRSNDVIEVCGSPQADGKLE